MCPNRMRSCLVSPGNAAELSSLARSSSTNAAVARSPSKGLPDPTARTAGTNSMPLMFLTTYPAAPARIASSMACSSANDVKIRQCNSGSLARNSRHNSTPLPSGSRTSNTTTSGRSAGMRANASLTEDACPIIFRSYSAFSSSASPTRTTSWSSTRTTVITP